MNFYGLDKVLVWFGKLLVTFFSMALVSFWYGFGMVVV